MIGIGFLIGYAVRISSCFARIGCLFLVPLPVCASAHAGHVLVFVVLRRTVFSHGRQL